MEVDLVHLKDIMNRNVKAVSPQVSAEEAWDRMRRQDLRHLVVRDDGRVLGVVSERDLGGRRGAALRRGRSVGDVMTTQVVTAKSSDTVRRAANLLRGYVIGCLPVVDEGRLKGIVTTTDLLELLGRGSEHPQRRVARPTMRHKTVRTRARRG